MYDAGCDAGHCCVSLLSNFLDCSHGWGSQTLLLLALNLIPWLRSWSRFASLKQKIPSPIRMKEKSDQDVDDDRLDTY